MYVHKFKLTQILSFKMSDKSDNSFKPSRILTLDFLLSSLVVISFSVGLVVFLWFLFSLNSDFNIFGEGEIKMAETGQVGDFIGGVVGALWALTGVFLLFVALRLQRKEFKAQREELSLQRNEIKNQRKEFIVNRITNIIYKQHDLISEKLKNLEFNVAKPDLFYRDNNSGFKGHSVLSVAPLSIYNNLSNKHKIEDFDDSDFSYLSKVIQFTIHTQVREYMNIYQTSVILCNNLINEKEYDKETKKEEFIIDETDRKQLFTLMGTIFDFQYNGEFFSTIKFVFEKRIEEGRLRGWEDVLLVYEKQELEKLNTLLPIIQKMQKERYTIQINDSFVSANTHPN